jgi:hypothetical protein
MSRRPAISVNDWESARELRLQVTTFDMRLRFAAAILVSMAALIHGGVHHQHTARSSINHRWSYQSQALRALELAGY